MIALAFCALCLGVILWVFLIILVGEGLGWAAAFIAAIFLLLK